MSDVGITSVLRRCVVGVASVGGLIACAAATLPAGPVTAQQSCQPMFDAVRLCAGFPQVLHQGGGAGLEIFVTNDGSVLFRLADAQDAPLQQVVERYVEARFAPEDLVRIDTVLAGDERHTVAYTAFPEILGTPRPEHPWPGLITAQRVGDTVLIAEFSKPNRDISTGAVPSTPEGTTLPDGVVTRHFDLLDRLEPVS